MPSTRESSTVSRKYVSHGGAISGQGHSANSASSLENNLDALLEDLQTSVSRSTTPSGRRPISPQYEYRSAANPVRTVTEVRSTSPVRTTTTTTEKYVSAAPVGLGSGIPGLESLDAELRNVQPGQSKTVAYKQVSYQYSKNQDGKPIDSFAATENALSSNTVPLSDDIHERSYEEIIRRRRSPERSTKTSTVNRELVYGDTYSSSRTKQPSPLGNQSKEVKIIRETSAFPSESKTISSNYHTRERTEDYGVERVPVPDHLAPGPNTKVTTTIKTYTYELPGAPETYVPPGGTGLDQTVTYKIDKTLERSASPIRYTSTPEVSQKSSVLHKESKYYHEDLHGSPTYGKPLTPSPVNYETTTTKKENFYIRDERYENLPRDRVDHPGYPGHPPYTETTTTTVIDRVEELYPDKSGSPRGYYTPPPPPTGGSSVYKYSKETHNLHDREVLLPKPFPTGTQLYPVNGKGPTNGEGPPKRVDDLMASFSDSEREVLMDIQREDRIQKKNRVKDDDTPKKEVDFVKHSPPVVQSKNVAGPPVYYPPGTTEFKMKEESSMAMKEGGGQWERGKGMYEYEKGSKSKQKQTSGKAVVPVCLPLCCAMPCTIM
ncbi:uncharacterized protein LOC135168237 [Diachasmimorpha longicaudata]|uniref:uncharacterized protein LOC135168237 n=1 Tax=Diachasmimorpha longicaudata TaxID=58733 RepID=UPI0030B9042E